MVSFRTELEQHFDQLVAHRSWFNFQKFAFHLAKQKWSELQATEPVHDLGADGVLFMNGEAKLALACSLDGNLEKITKGLPQTQRSQAKDEKDRFRNNAKSY